MKGLSLSSTSVASNAFVGAAIVTLVDAERPRGGKPVELRQVVDGIRWVLHTQAHWSDIPATYAASTTCWRWYKRWCSDGTWPKVEALIAEIGKVREVEVDDLFGYGPFPRPSVKRPRPAVTAQGPR